MSLDVADRLGVALPVVKEANTKTSKEKPVPASTRASDGADFVRSMYARAWVASMNFLTNQSALRYSIMAVVGAWLHFHGAAIPEVHSRLVARQTHEGISDPKDVANAAMPGKGAPELALQALAGGDTLQALGPGRAEAIGGEPVALHVTRSETFPTPEMPHGGRELTLCSFNCLSNREGGKPVHAVEVRKTLEQMAKEKGVDVFMLQECPIPEGQTAGNWLGETLLEQFDVYTAKAPRDRGWVTLAVKKELFEKGSVTSSGDALKSPYRKQFHKGTKGLVTIVGTMKVKQPDGSYKDVRVSLSSGHLELFPRNRGAQARFMGESIHRVQKQTGKLADVTVVGADLNNFSNSRARLMHQFGRIFGGGTQDHFARWTTAKLFSGALPGFDTIARFTKGGPRFSRDTLISNTRDGYRLIPRTQETISPQAFDGKEISDHQAVIMSATVA